MKFNGKIYFLIYFSELYGDNWELGEIFLKKYYMCFDQDNKRIGYYFKEKKKKEFFFSFPWILVFSLFLIILLMGYIIFYLFRKMKIRRKRANELDDGFDYMMANEGDKAIN